MKLRSALIVIIVILLLLDSAAKLNQAGNHQQNGLDSAPFYFTSTGHTLRQPFLSYYLEKNGVERLGPPITDVLTDNGWQVQYFQFGRLEIHPENDPEYRITVGWLGDALHRRRATPPGETSHMVHGSIARHYKEQGGQVHFGRPISAAHYQNGYLVQDFQSARLRWQPWYQGEAQVTPTPIGETHFISAGWPLRHLQPQPKPSTAVTFSQAVEPLPEEAGINLYTETVENRALVRVIAEVHDAAGHPLPQRQLWLHWEAGQRPMPLTRNDGRSHLLLSVTTPTRFQLTANATSTTTLAKIIVR